MAMTEQALADGLVVRRKKIDALKRGLYPENVFDRGYVINVRYDPLAMGVPEVEEIVSPERTVSNIRVAGTAQVDKNTLFYAAGIQCTLLTAGIPPTATPDATSASQQTTIPAISRLFRTGLVGGLPLVGSVGGQGGFRWRIRDTGQDREWQNDWLPGTLVLSGNEFPLMASRGLGLLSGGAIIEVSVMVLEINAYLDTTNNDNPIDYRFTVFGAERRLA